LRADGWAEKLASGTQIEIQVRPPATTHCVSILQLRRWAESIKPSAAEMVKKRKLRELLVGPAGAWLFYITVSSSWRVTLNLP
jgi:hypothetical protein